MPFYELAMGVVKAREAYAADKKVRMDWAPVADGHCYLGNGMQAGFRKESAHIPALVGNVFGEFESNALSPLREKYGPKAFWTEEITHACIRERFGESAGTAVSAFRRACPEMPESDLLFFSVQARKRHLDVAKKLAESENRAVYNWLMTLELPAEGGSTPWHNAEEPFVFHNTQYLESTYMGEITDRLQDIMSGAWTAFAYSGNPNHSGIPTWRPLTGGHVPTMLFDRKCRLRTDHDRELCDLLCELDMPDAGSKGPALSYGGGPRCE